MGALEQDVLANVNLLRRQHGLGALRLSTKLSAAARSHSAEMAQRGYFSHDSANGTSFDKRISRFYSLGGKRYWSVGENLLWSSPDVSASAALDMWLNSPEHKKILITARWREIGLAAVHVQLGSWFVRRTRSHHRDRRFRRQALGTATNPAPRRDKSGGASAPP